MSIFKKVVALVLVFTLCMAFPMTANATELSDDECIILDRFYIPLTATVYGSNVKSTQVEIGADVIIQQLRGTNQIRTIIEVQTADFWSAVEIASFSETIRYTNFTEFSIPDFYENVSKTASSPTNFLKAINDSGTSFVTGHTIGITVSITDVQLANATLAFTPGGYSTKVTIR